MATSTSSLPEHFTLSVSDIDTTGLQVVAVHDVRTGFTVRTAVGDAERQVPAIMAFAGARYSRSALTAEELFAEINAGKKSAQEKLANIFVNYGHASVGDMAMLFAYLEQVPRHILMHFFAASSVGSGQERSSRYQDFSTSRGPDWSQLLPNTLPAHQKSELAQRADALFADGIAAYSRLLPVVTKRYEKHFQLDATNKSHASALQARVFDTVRAFLPLGARTSAAYICSSREWARLIQWLKSDISPESICLGEQLELLFAPPKEAADKIGYLPEAPDLIRYTQPDPRTASLLESLQKLASDLIQTTPRNEKLKRHKQSVSLVPESATQGQKYLYFALLCLRPKLKWSDFIQWESTLTPQKRKKISAILLSEFTHHQHLPHWCRTGGMTFEMNLTVSEAIDFNRHRAWGRFSPWLESQQTEELLSDGYITPAYLDIPALEDLRTEFCDTLEKYYTAIKNLAADLPEGTSPHFIQSLIPNAQRIRYFLTGGPKEISYLTQLRVRPGGHINYRMLAYDLAKLAAQTDPLLAALNLGKDRKPDPASQSEFFDRS
jgi:thymidylate synthase ThyX